MQLCIANNFNYLLIKILFFILLIVLLTETFKSADESKREGVLVSAESVQDLRKSFGNNVLLI